MSVCLSLRMYIHQPKFFSDFNEIWYLGSHIGRWVIHDCMPYDPIQGQGQGHGGVKVVKMANFKVYLLRRYACNLKSDGEYDTPRQYQNFNCINFWYSSSFCHVTFKLRVFHLCKWILILMRSRLAVLYGAIFYFSILHNILYIHILFWCKSVIMSPIFSCI